MVDPSGKRLQFANLKMAQSKSREFSHENSMVMFNSYVNVYQRVCRSIFFPPIQWMFARCVA
jgi:hypothetical protein